jgi:hypothetical protein
MRIAKDILRFAADLVSHYATYDRIGGYYQLNVFDLPDTDLHEFAQLYMRDPDLSSEANGADNPAYDKYMLPALLRYMQNTSDRDNEIEFKHEWVKGVTSYFLKSMQEAIDEECNKYLHSIRNEAGLYAHKRPDNGEIFWSKQL